jgi:hypothetical protein
MLNMVFTVMSRFIESYGSVVLEVSKDWFILYKIVFVPVSLFIYCLAFFVISGVLLIVIFITRPISFISNAFFK